MNYAAWERTVFFNPYRWGPRRRAALPSDGPRRADLQAPQPLPVDAPRSLIKARREVLKAQAKVNGLWGPAAPWSPEGYRKALAQLSSRWHRLVLAKRKLRRRALNTASP